MEWRALQEDMLRSYLVTAQVRAYLLTYLQIYLQPSIYLQEDLTNKRELVSTKQARLSLAQDEFHHLNTTMSAQLSQSTTSCK